MELAGRKSERGDVSTDTSSDEVKPTQEHPQVVPAFKILTRKDKGGPVATNSEAFSPEFPKVETFRKSVTEENSLGGGGPELLEKPAVSHVLAELLARGKNGGKGHTDKWSSSKTDSSTYHFTHKASSPVKPSVFGIGMGAAQQASAEAGRSIDSKRAGAGLLQEDGNNVGNVDADGEDSGPEKRTFRSIGIAERLRLQQQEKQKQEQRQENSEKGRLQLEKELFGLTRQRPGQDRRRQDHQPQQQPQQRQHQQYHPKSKAQSQQWTPAHHLTKRSDQTEQPTSERASTEAQAQEPAESTWHWNTNAKAWVPPPKPNDFAFHPAPDYSPQIRPVELDSVPPPSVEPNVDILGPSLAAPTTFGESTFVLRRAPLNLALATASNEPWAWTSKDEAAFQALQQQKNAASQGTLFARDAPQEQIRSSKKTNKINPSASVPVPPKTSNMSTYLEQWKLGNKGLEPEIMI